MVAVVYERWLLTRGSKHSDLTRKCLVVWGLIAQLVEHCTGIACRGHLIAGKRQRGSLLFFTIARFGQNLSDLRLGTCAVECRRSLYPGACGFGDMRSRF